MPDGVRNGISADTNTDTAFQCDKKGEEEEDEPDEMNFDSGATSQNDGKRLKKPFNLNLIDLFKAGVMDTNNTKLGEKNGTCSPNQRLTLSSGPRDSDYVMMVLNQKHRDSEEISMLIDRLKENGVTCIFIRNGTNKSLSEVPEVTKSKPFLSENSDNSPTTNEVCSSVPPSSPISEIVQNKAIVNIRPCNGMKSPNSVSDSNANIVAVQNHSEDSNRKSVDLPVLAISNSESSSQFEEALVSEEIPTPIPIKKKRRRRRKYPYLVRKPAKKKSICKNNKELNQTSINGTTNLKTDLVTPSVTLSSVDVDECASSNINNVPIKSVLLPSDIRSDKLNPNSPVPTEDPYVFIPEDEFDSPPLKLFSPKISRKNGANSELELFSGSGSGSDNSPEEKVKSKGHKRRKKEPMKKSEGSIAPDSNSTLITDSNPSCPPSKLLETLPSSSLENVEDCPPEVEEKKVSPVKKPRSKRRRKKRSFTPAKSKSKYKVQNTKTCVQPISSSVAEVSGTVKDDNEVRTDEISAKEDPPKPSTTSNSKEDSDELPGSVSVVVAEVSKDNKDSGGHDVTDSKDLFESIKLKVEFAKPFPVPYNGQPEDSKPNSIPQPESTNTEIEAIEVKTDYESNFEASIPTTVDASTMQLRRPSFYSLIAGNVRNNLENHLDGKVSTPTANGVKQKRRKKPRIRNGFLLHHGDNFPEDPEAPYKLHLATQIILKLNKRRSKFKPKEDKVKSLLSYLKLVPKRASRAGKNSQVQATSEEVCDQEKVPEEQSQIPVSVFSGEWIQERNYICNICGHVESYFWDMVHHKGEIHPGIVVTHVELADMPPVGFRGPPPVPSTSGLQPPPCTKCSATFSNYPDLHRHVFECAGNAAWLEELKVQPQRKKKPKRKRGFNSFKRRLSNTPKKPNPKPKTDVSPVKRRTTEVFKCEFCTREFKTEGWLKNHLTTHSLPISIPLNKLTLPPRASTIFGRRSVVHNLIANGSFKT